MNGIPGMPVATLDLMVRSLSAGDYALAGAFRAVLVVRRDGRSYVGCLVSNQGCCMCSGCLPGGTRFFSVAPVYGILHYEGSHRIRLLDQARRYA